jgi:hypothetical protein
VTQWKANRIRRIDSEGRITALAGTGVGGYDGDDHPAISAQLNGPGGPSPLPSGAVVFSDMNNNRVRAVSPDGLITTPRRIGSARIITRGGRRG